jgi:hypothetical protein
MSNNKEYSRFEIFVMQLGVLGELFQLFLHGDRKWLLPLGVLLGLMGMVLVFIQSMEYIAPFVYMAF